MKALVTNLDVVDRCLLALLQVDGRLTHSYMARCLGVPEATIRRRTKRLVDEGITRFVTLPDPNKSGYGVQVIIGLKLQPGSIRGAIAILQPLSQVRYIGITAGNYDLLLETYFRDNQGLRTFLTDTLGQIPGLVSSETSYVLEIVKRSYQIDLLAALEELTLTAEEAVVLERCRVTLRDLAAPGNPESDVETESPERGT